MIGELGTFDLETTGVDVESDRIVSAYIALTKPDGIVVEHEWLLSPGVEIPAGATAVHGITTARAQAEGMDPGDALVQIAAILADITDRGIPLVVYNAPFDLTLLDREIRRHSIGEGIWFPLTRIVDPLVLDKAMDTYRKGPRTLSAVYAHRTGGATAEWHGAKADALAAGHLARLLLADFRLTDATPDELHKWQIVWARRQAKSFAEYNLTRKGEDASDVSPEWPIRAWREL